MIQKFRFWFEREDFYPDENFMCDVYKIEYIADNKIELNDAYIFNPYTNVAEDFYAKAKIYLMKSIGLKDKNGIPIFEGDIVRRTHLFDESFGKIYIGEIVYDKDYARYVMSKPQKYTEPRTEDLGNILSTTSIYEVIGNVYQNPELLEVSE